MYDDQWAQMLQYSYLNIWNEISLLLPNILAAILIIIAGFIIAKIAKKAVRHLVGALQIDSALQSTGAHEVAARTGYKLNTGEFLGTIVKWFILILFFIFALDVLNLNEATAFFTEAVLGYLPRVVVATVILFGGLLIAEVVQRLVVAAATAVQFKQSLFLGRFAKYSVLVFAVLAALNELQIATELVQMLFGGMVFALSLAFGLSFGLGGRDAAARYINKATQSQDIL